MPVMIELVLANLPAQRIAVNSQLLRGLRLVSFSSIQNALDEALLKFLDGLVKQDTLLDHLRDEAFQLIFHGDTLRTH